MKKKKRNPLVMRSSVWIQNGRLFRDWRCIWSSTESISAREAEMLARKIYGTTKWMLRSHNARLPRGTSY